MHWFILYIFCLFFIGVIFRLFFFSLFIGIVTFYNVWRKIDLISSNIFLLLGWWRNMLMIVIFRLLGGIILIIFYILNMWLECLFRYRLTFINFIAKYFFLKLPVRIHRTQKKNKWCKKTPKHYKFNSCWLIKCWVKQSI
jgi:hypothetical protein